MMDFKTEGEAFAFVSRNGWALEHVPEAAKTEDACIAAATLDCRVFRLLPARFKTSRVCLEAVKADGFALEYIPMARRTAEVRRAAVRHPQSA